MTTQSFPLVSPEALEESDLGLQQLFQSFLPTSANPFQRNYFSGLFQPTFQQYLGQLGSQVRQGQDPTLTFTNFLTNQFNPGRALLRMSGAESGRTAGPTLFNYFQ